MKEKNIPISDPNETPKSAQQHVFKMQQQQQATKPAVKKTGMRTMADVRREEEEDF